MNGAVHGLATTTHLTHEQMRHHPDQQHRQQVERGEHRDRALAALGDAGNRAADQPEEHREPDRHQPPVVPRREDEADHHHEHGIAGLDLALAAPHRLPRQEQAEVGEHERARPPLRNAPRDRRVQRQKHETEPHLRLGRHPADGRLAGGRRAGCAGQGAFVILCHQEIVA
jgi:hypothetical protein